MPYIKNKAVLDIGCVEHDIRNKNKKRIWVHDFLKEHTKHVIGIDILKKDIEILKKQGYDIYYQNAETFKFNKKFDVIFAGELIEHLSNPGLFLEKCRKHLKKNGLLILTTPNAFGLHRLIRSFLKLNSNTPVNNEHTAWFSPTVMATLLGRYGFKIVKMDYADYPYFKCGLDERISNFLSNFFPKLKETMIIFSRKKF